MAFFLKNGLFQYDLTDHHAVLGVAVTADPGAVRKRYLKLARLLHPDSLRKASEVEKKKASELLSKLVNPAYEVLKGKARNEHQIVLEQTGKRLASEGSAPNLTSEIAQSVFKASGDVGAAYNQALNALAKQQYQSMGEAISAIETLSELNLVYLFKRSGQGVRTKAPTPSGLPPKKPTNTPSPKTPTAAPGAPQAEAAGSPVDTYVRRAKEYITKNNFAKAVLELRDALKIEPQNSQCHALVGMAYLRQNQISMAKVHTAKALQFNPQEPTALKCKAVLEKKLGKSLGGSSSSTKGSSAAKTSKTQKTAKSQSGGRFGGLFGGKKK